MALNYNKKTVRDVDVSGKKVLLRCDFNVPQDKDTGAITDDKRIVSALPTIRYLLENGAAVIACSHLGKPKGFDPAFSLAVVAKRLSELLGMEVIFANDVVGEDARAKTASLKCGQVMLLENTRFESGETKNDPELSKALASLADLYVSDAFGSVHRAHASTAGVAAYLPAVSGFLIAQELSIMGNALANPRRPLVAILGGSKVSGSSFNSKSCSTLLRSASSQVKRIICLPDFSRQTNSSQMPSAIQRASSGQAFCGRLPKRL